ncbi:hypothetical protein MSAN_01519200 [Mycena sanguinolenta]|uniref:Uncharacterized protein n=1 Tax=Mycena sanguinolenta TaxID=230812 RepID=A0A8H6Y632_9AGAR|nr:hypothetical protein MSAN_01519200 [Mycena sanguinolenta]
MSGIDITSLAAGLPSLVLESCLYGIALILFISTIYFIATRRTLAGNRQTVKHHFISPVFVGATVLFLAATAHWIVEIYLTFHLFSHFRGAIPEQAFYTSPTHGTDMAEAALVFIAIVVGDSLVIYRLWIVWARNLRVLIFPICGLSGVLVMVIGVSYVFSHSKSNAPFLNNAELKPWVATGFVLSLLTSVYCTGFIAYRILKFSIRSTKNSNLTFFLAIIVESATLQTFWLIFASATNLAGSSVEFLTLGGFPVVLCISNLLIHARVGLGWSPEPTGLQAANREYQGAV